MNQYLNKFIITTIVAIFLLFASTSYSDAVKPRVDGSYMNDLRLVRKTPHLEFAKPNASGVTRALFVAPQRLACREVAELLQRLDLKADVVATVNDKQLGVDKKNFYLGTVKGWLKTEKEAELEQKLKKTHDVIVLGHFSLKALPKEMQREILRQVEEQGKGLLIVFDNPLPSGFMNRLIKKPLNTDREWIYRAVPLNYLYQSRPLMKSPPSDKQLRLYQLGKGRVVLLQQPMISVLDKASGGTNSLTPVVEYDQRSPTIYQHLLSLPARALLWCANRVSKTRFKLPEKTVTRNGNEPLQFVVQADHNFKGKVKMVLTDQYGNLIHQAEENTMFKTGHKSMRFQLPHLWHGIFYANLWLKDENNKTFDWGAVPVRAGKRRISLTHVFPKGRRVLKPGDPISSSVRLVNPSSLKNGETVELLLKDNYERVIRKMKGKVDGEKIRFETRVPARSSTIWLEFVVMRDGKLIDSQRNPAWRFRVEKNYKARFFSTLWGCTNSGILAYWDYKAYADIGFTTIINNGRRNIIPAYLDWDLIKFSYPLVPWNPQNKKYIKRWKENGTKSFPYEAWMHADDRRNYLESWSTVCLRDIQQGNLVRCYSFGDEIKLGGRNIGFNDWWLPAFHEYLKKVYGNSIANLNRSWHSSYSSFNDVRPKKSEDVISMVQWMEKKKVANDGSFTKPQNSPKQVRTYAPYLDHRRFVEKEFPEMITATRAALHKYNPNAGIGFEGAGSQEAYYGLDMAEIARNSDMLVPYYNRSSLELIRSFKPRKTTLGCWSVNYISHRLSPGMIITGLWDPLFSGANSLWVFTDTGSEGGLNLDLSWASHFPVEDIRKLNSGLGEWMAHAEIVDDPVAVHYSMTNSELHTLEYPWGYSININQAWIYLLNDMGYNVRYVDSKLIEAGELIKGGYRVLVLPNSLSLSQKETNEIKNFVRQGGLVVADLRPGVMNEHGLYLKNGQLDKLFGIRRTSTERKTRLQKIVVTAMVKTFPNRKRKVKNTSVKLNLSVTDVDPTVSPLVGTVYSRLKNRLPIVCQRCVGKGEATLLNFNIYPYYKANHDSRFGKKAKKRGYGLQKLMQAVLAKAGLKPKFPITPNYQSQDMGIRRVLFQSGNTKLLAVMRNLSSQAVLDALGQAKTSNLRPKSAKKKLQVNVDLNGTYYVYDVLKGMFLGKRSSIDIFLPHANPRLFALLNEPALKPEIILAPASVLKRGGQVIIKIKLGAARQGALVTIVEPDGMVRRWSKRITITDNKGLSEVNIPLAFNERVGQYRITVQNILTGMRNEIPFELK